MHRRFDAFLGPPFRLVFRPSCNRVVQGSDITRELRPRCPAAVCRVTALEAMHVGGHLMTLWWWVSRPAAADLHAVAMPLLKRTRIVGVVAAVAVPPLSPPSVAGLPAATLFVPAFSCLAFIAGIRTEQRTLAGRFARGPSMAEEYGGVHE